MNGIRLMKLLASLPFSIIILFDFDLGPHVLELWPAFLHLLHVTTLPALETLVAFLDSPGSHLLSFLGLPDIFTYAGG